MNPSRKSSMALNTLAESLLDSVPDDRAWVNVELAIQLDAWSASRAQCRYLTADGIWHGVETSDRADSAIMTLMRLRADEAETWNNLRLLVSDVQSGTTRFEVFLS